MAYLPPRYFNQYPDCVGIPLNSLSLKILSEDGQSVGIDEVGILWVKGPNVMIGYFNNPEKTAEVVRDGWLCTGNLASVNKDGLLKIHGRSDDLIIKTGMNIYPGEVESAVKQDSRVQEVCVRSETDNRFGIQIVMDIVGVFSNSTEVREMCRMYLPSYQVPAKDNLFAKLPKNGSGKIIRR